MLRWNRRTPHFRVHLLELRRELLQNFVNRRADGPQRMVFAHSLLRGNVAKHVTLLLIGSSHAPLDAFCAASLQLFQLFPQPASAGRVLRCPTARKTTLWEASSPTIRPHWTYSHLGMRYQAVGISRPWPWMIECRTESQQ